MRRFALALLATASLTGAASAESPPVNMKDLVKTIKAVGPEGKGNDAAANASAMLSSGSLDLVPFILESFDDANPVANNWLRSSIDTLVEKGRNAKVKLDAKPLTAYIGNIKNSPTGRRLAYDILAVDHTELANGLVPGFLDDPQPDLRRLAIEHGLKQITGEDATAIKAYQTLLTSARDEDQIGDIAKKLEDLKAPVNLTKHFGFITEWNVSTAFDNKDGVGFAKAFDPEAKLDTSTWKHAQSADQMGMVDLNKAVEKKKSIVAYASTKLIAEEEITLDVRALSQNATKIFVNGKEVLAREEYHHGAFLDQHRATVTLKKGENELLIKICQNDQTQPWCEPWGFACRLSDSTGKAIRLKHIVVKDSKPTTVEMGELAEKPAAPKKEEK
jgi:hypothetical protein